jgi:uncharacterized membrane protein YbhN (UPF0104 family)
MSSHFGFEDGLSFAVGFGSSEHAEDETGMEAQPASQPIAARMSTAWKMAKRVLPFALAALIAVSLWKQIPAAADALKKTHPVALFVLVFFVAWNQVATLAWRALLRATGAAPAPLRDLVRLRIEAQAVNQVVPSAGVAGEALRAVRAGGRRNVGASSLATILDNVCGTISGLVFAVGVFAFHLTSRGGEGRLHALMAGVAAALVLLTVAVVLPFYVAPRVLPYLSRTSSLRWLVTPFAERASEMQRALRDATALRFVERLLAVGEVYVVFHAVGAPMPLGDAAMVSAVLVTLSFAVFFSPGQLGVAEAAMAAVSVFLGFSAAQGLAAALLRRARQLIVCLIGGVSLLLHKYSRESEAPARPLEEAP